MVAVAETAGGDRPNLVLVTIDSLRADHCGFHDPPPDAAWSGSLTPTLDAMAAEGVVYGNAVAPGPRTPSSMPVVWTGEFPHHGDLGVYDSWPEKSERWLARRGRIRRHLSRNRPLPVRLAQRGYDTGAVTANPWTDRDTGFDRGFDAFRSVADRPTGGPVGTAVDRLPGVEDDGWLLSWPDFYEDVLAVRGELSEPYLLWVFLLDPHQPYLAPRRYREENTAPEMVYANLRYNRWHGYTDDLPAHLHRRLTAAYRDTVRSTDAFVARLRDDLRGDDPVTVVHADHGEAFADHGVYGHRLQLYEENVHVPLVVHGPDTGEERVPGPTSLRRLPAMLTDLADGRFDDPAAYASAYARCATEERERTGVRTRRWKFLRGGEEWPYVRAGEGEALYDLGSDPGERTNLAGPGEHAEAGRLFDRLLDAHEGDLAERARVAAASHDLDGV